MIVPTNRLLVGVASVLVPAAAFATLAPGSAAPLAAVGALFVLAVAADALAAPGRLRGLSLGLPSIVRLTKDRPGKVEVRLRSDASPTRIARVGLAFPAAIACERPELLAAVPPEVSEGKISFAVVPNARGRFDVNGGRLEAASPLGFWTARRSSGGLSEIRVFPDLLAEKKGIATLFLNRGGAGVHPRRQVGRGRDFEKLREYVAGDDYGEIHWKATARRGRPVTKVFQVERTQEVYVVVDASRLSGRRVPSLTETEGPPALERFVTAALVLGFAAERQGDLFGLVTFSDKVERFVRAGTGRAHFRVCRDVLSTLSTRPVSPDFEELCTFLRLRLRRRALLVFLTELDDPHVAETFTKDIELVSRHHLVLVNAFRPEAAQPLFEDDAVRTGDDLYERLGGHLVWQTLRQLQRVLKRSGVTFSLLSNEALSAGLVSQYMDVKARQAL